MKYKIITTPTRNSDVEMEEDEALAAAERDWQKRVARRREMKRRHSFNHTMKG